MAQEAIFHTFCTQIQKIVKFEPTFDYIMLRNLRTVRLIFPKIAAKVAQDFKEKSHESLRREFFSPETIARNVEGGFRPPPPGLLGLNGAFGWYGPLSEDREKF